MSPKNVSHCSYTVSTSSRYVSENPQGTAGSTSAGFVFSAVDSARRYFGGLVDLWHNRGDVQFFELFRGDGRRVLGHEILAFLRLLEGDDVTDVRRAAGERANYCLGESSATFQEGRGFFCAAMNSTV
jgi:hypothetical protein